MKFENIVKQLKKEGFEIVPMQFSFKDCLGVQGTALIDTIDGEVTPTNAKFSSVVKQITEGRSHIQTIEVIKGCNKKTLSQYQKWQE